MIGVYDYTVILTYLSLISGCIGIIITMTGMGHPYIGIVFLLISGCLDGFDGKIARTKKNRSEFEKNFGMQIDSLADLICFGVLPATIGVALLRRKGIFTEVINHHDYGDKFGIIIILLTIAIFYILAALIRLAYFNCTCEERKKEAAETGQEYYIGLPVTTSALVFPLTLIVHYFIKPDLTIVYFLVMLIVAIMFVLNIKVKKSGKNGLMVMVCIGLFEFIATLIIMNI